MGNSSQMIFLFEIVVKQPALYNLKYKSILTTTTCSPDNQKIKNPSFPFLQTNLCKSRAETNLGEILLHFKLNESFFGSAFHFNLDYPDGIFFYLEMNPFISLTTDFSVFILLFYFLSAFEIQMQIQWYFLNFP